LDDVSKKLQLSTDFIQTFGFAARETGVGTNAAEMALQRFSRRLGEAQQGTGELVKMLSRYNIELKNTDGTYRSTEEVLYDYADAIGNARNANEQLLLANKAFDSEGVGMVTVMRDGVKGLKQWEDRARSFGQIMDSETIQSLARAENAIERFKIRSVNFFGGVLASVEELLNGIDKLGKKKSFGIFLESKGLDFFNWMSSQGNTVEVPFKPVVNQPDQSPEVPFLETFTDLQKKLNLEQLRGQVFNANEYDNLYESSLSKQNEILEQIIESALGANKEVEALNAELTLLGNEQALDDLKDKFKMPEGESTLRFNLNMASLTEDTDRIKQATSELIQYYDGVAASAKEAGEIDIFQQVRLSAEELRKSLKDIKPELTEMQRFSQGVGDVLANSLANAARNGKFEIKDLADYVIAELTRIAAQKLIIDKLFGSSNSSDNASTVGSLFSKAITSYFGGGGGSRAAGGPVNANTSYVVGERGPEIFTPSSNGYVSKNTGGNTYYIDAKGADQAGFAHLTRVIQELNGSIEKRAINAVHQEYNRRGGYLQR